MKRKVLEAIGVVISLSGVVLLCMTLYTHNEYKQKMADLMKNRVILEKQDKVSEDEDAEYSSSLVDFTIEGLDEDQKVKEITQGTPWIEIPSLNVQVPVTGGTDNKSLRLGAGKFEESVEMGEIGNFAVAGHSSTVYNCIFNTLDEIKLFDEIRCYNKSGEEFTYYVTDKFVAAPDQISVLSHTDERTITIVTCTDGGTARFIVVGKMLSEDELNNLKRVRHEDIIAKAVEISDNIYDDDILEYLDGKKLPTRSYEIAYTGVENCFPFFYNYVADKGLLVRQEHKVNEDFSQSIGF